MMDETEGNGQSIFILRRLHGFCLAELNQSIPGALFFMITTVPCSSAKRAAWEKVWFASERLSIACVFANIAITSVIPNLLLVHL